MRKRKRQRSTVIRRDERRDSENRYYYELIMKEGEDVASFGLPLYSIKVNMTDGFGKDSEANIKDAFADAGKALVFYEKLVRNLATPIDLAYIAEDEIR